MNLSERTRYILRAVLGYFALAAMWILLSDRMLAGLTSVAIAARLSTIKGLAFVAVTSALLWLALRHTPDRAPDGVAPDAESRPWALVGVFLLLAVAIAAIAGVAFKVQSDALRARELHKLEGIARLKADGIARWLGERRANAVSLARSAAVRTALARLNGRNGAAERNRLEDIFRERADVYGFSGIEAMDATGRRILEEGGLLRHDSAYLGRLIFDAVRSGGLGFVDLHRDRRQRDIHMAFLSPVFEGEGDGRRLLGVVYLEAMPQSFLYPYLKEWPALEATSGETLMVRREGDEVLFLSELRHVVGAPLVLRRPLSESSLPAARAAKGQVTGAAGTDYRGVAVLAAGQQVPGTPWIVVAKVDEAEALAPVRRLAWMTGLLVAAALAAALAFVVSLWQAQRRRATEREAVQQAQYQQLFESMSSGAAIYRAVEAGADFVFAGINAAVERIERVKRGDVVGRRVTEVFPGVTEFGLLEVLRRVWRTGEPEHFPIAFYHDERIAGWRDNYIYRLPGGEVVAVYDDVTERKQAEESLRLSEEHFRGIFDGALDGILVADAETRRFVMGNPAIRQMLGYGEEELLRLGVVDIHPERDLPHAVEQFERVARGEIQLAADIPVKRKDGSVFYADIKGSPVRFGDRRCLIGVFRDVSERRRVEEEIRRLNAELEERVRRRTAELEAANKELETFAYSVSHDLKAPLRAIDGYSQLLIEGHAARLDEEGRSFLDSIRRGARKMHALIDDLLAYARMERCEPFIARVGIDEIVKRALVDIAAGETAVRPEVGLACGAAVADPDGLTLVLRNLLDNAVKFSRGAQPPKVEIGSRREGDKCLLWVKDNGIGFDMRHHDRIFGIFQRLHGENAYPGTGVGLAIVRKAAERMGGRVWAESAPGEGATFFVELPA